LIAFLTGAHVLFLQWMDLRHEAFMLWFRTPLAEARGAFWATPAGARAWEGFLLECSLLVSAVVVLVALGFVQRRVVLDPARRSLVEAWYAFDREVARSSRPIPGRLFLLADLRSPWRSPDKATLHLRGRDGWEARLEWPLREVDVALADLRDAARHLEAPTLVVLGSPR
jgi:hypothetical protein